MAGIDEPAPVEKQTPFEKRKDVARWLKGRPRADGVAVAARAAARVLPLLVRAVERDDPLGPRRFANLTLAALRATALACAAATYPTRANELAAAIWAAIDTDATVIEQLGAAALLAAPLWPNGASAWAAEAWARLKSSLRPEDRWAPWFEWYEALLAGRPPWPELAAAEREELEIRICLIDEEFWAAGAATANAEIERLIAEAMPARIASQEPGPHFGLDEEKRIEPSAHYEYDADGNIPQRIRSLLPAARRAAEDLAAALPDNDPQRLKRDAQTYRDAIAPDPDRIDWGMVYGYGLFIENAAAAAEREIADRTVPPLEDPAQAALESLRTLHLNLIMASGEGRKLMEEADALRLTREAQQALRDDARAIAAELGEAPDVAIRPTAERVERAADAIGQGPFAERGTQFGLAALGNVSVVLVSAATISGLVATAYFEAGGVAAAAAAAGPAWLGYESLKKSKKFAEATAALGLSYDQILDSAREAARTQMVLFAPFRQFVRDNEAELRRIAERAPRMRWMLRYLDFIVASEADPSA